MMRMWIKQWSDLVGCEVTQPSLMPMACIEMSNECFIVMFIRHFLTVRSHRANKCLHSFNRRKRCTSCMQMASDLGTRHVCCPFGVKSDSATVLLIIWWLLLRSMLNVHFFLRKGTGVGRDDDDDDDFMYHSSIGICNPSHENKARKYCPILY